MSPTLSLVRGGFLTILLAGLLVAGLTAEADEQAVPPAGLPELKLPDPVPVRQAIQRYLAQKTGKNPAGTAIPTKSPWVWCAEQYAAASKQDAKVLYGLIAEHLAIANKRYLGSKVDEERRKGLGMVSEAAQCASRRLKDHPLAVQIAEGYVMPYLAAADEHHWKYLGKHNLLEVVADVYAQANDAPKFTAMLKLILEDAPNRNTADAARLRLAQMLDKQGRHAEALHYLKEIDEQAGVGGARKLIPEIEKKLKAKKEGRP